VHIVVLTPVLDDWISARELLSRLDAAFAAKEETVSILLVDDGSSERIPADFGTGPYTRLQEVNVLELRKNLGHQRALAVGLCYLAEKVPCDAVVVMDSDGEDEAPDAVRLVEELQTWTPRGNGVPPIIFAERTHRSESLVFRLGYLGYRLLHFVLTGRGIRFGNFSIIPRERLGGLTVEPMLWNHYAASVVATRVPFSSITTHRGSRFAGTSHQNFVKLVIHGLSALSCYNERIGVRLLLFSSVLLVLSFIAIMITFGLRLFTQLPILGWTSIFAGILMVFLFQVITLASTFTMQIISTRSVQPFLPARDYAWYVDRIESRLRRP
jgi:glycosyltransferase involved in cell wall biosynthesis